MTASNGTQRTLFSSVQPTKRSNETTCGWNAARHTLLNAIIGLQTCRRTKSSTDYLRAICSKTTHTYEIRFLSLPFDARDYLRSDLVHTRHPRKRFRKHAAILSQSVRLWAPRYYLVAQCWYKTPFTAWSSLLRLHLFHMVHHSGKNQANVRCGGRG